MYEWMDGSTVHCNCVAMATPCAVQFHTWFKSLHSRFFPAKKIQLVCRFWCNFNQNILIVRSPSCLLLIIIPCYTLHIYYRHFGKSNLYQFYFVCVWTITIAYRTNRTEHWQTIPSHLKPSVINFKWNKWNSVNNNVEKWYNKSLAETFHLLFLRNQT